MSRGLWLRFFGISISFAVVLSGLYLVLIREVVGGQSNEVQRSVYLFLTRIVEEQPYDKAIAQIRRFRAESPAMPVELWVISETGRVLASSIDTPPPAELLDRGRPQRVHEPVLNGRFFSGGPAGAIVRLDAAEPTYLLMHNPGTPSRGVLRTLLLVFLVMLAGAVFIGLLLITLYLRGRSSEVQRVIARMESGDLAVRFTVDRLDAIGGLMLNFNRMADEIQRLVMQLQTTERTRRELLQELGHDLRTPLTSLRTAIETLAAHGNVMAPAERADFFSVITSELGYFTKLIDDLFFIAEIDEPRYRGHAEPIDLPALIASEMRTLQGNGKHPGIAFQLQCEESAPHAHDIVGDPYLISRLFRNVFDNAARHAAATVLASIVRRDDGVEVVVQDDGAGMSAEAIAGFGKRRNQRLIAGGSTGVSLGLGSVIIKTIVELHGGELEVRSRATDDTVKGTRLRFYFPFNRQAVAPSTATFAGGD